MVDNRRRVKSLIASPYEREVYDLIRWAADGATIYPKIRVADVLELDVADMTPQQKRVYTAGHFDFAVADETVVQFVVEVDSAYHHDPEQKRRDEAKDTLCKQAGLTILRFDLSTDIEGREIRDRVREAWIETSHPYARYFTFGIWSQLREQYSPLDLRRDIVKAIAANCSDETVVFNLGERYSRRFRRSAPLYGTQHIAFAWGMDLVEKAALPIISQGPKDEGPRLFVELMVLLSEIPGMVEFAQGLVDIACDIGQSDDRTEAVRAWVSSLSRLIEAKYEMEASDDEFLANWRELTQRGRATA